MLVDLGELCLAVLLLGGMALLGSWMSNRKRFAQLARLPGPRPLPLIGNLLEFITNDYAYVSTFLGIAKRYDGFFRLWLGRNPAVVITDPEHLQIYFTNPSMLDRATLVYPILASITDGQSVVLANGAQWKKLRKMFMLSFNQSPAETHRENAVGGQKTMLDMFCEQADGPVFPARSILALTLARSILLNVLSMKIDGDLLSSLLSDLTFLQKTAWDRNFSPLYKSNLIFKMSPLGREFHRKRANVLNTVGGGIITKKKEIAEMEARGEALPNLYIYNLLKNHGHEKMDVLIAELATALSAGMDTTSSTAGFVLTCLGLYPDLQQQMYEEDQQIMRRLNGRTPDLDDLKRYEFLDRFIKETLRFFPIGPIIGRRANEDTYFGKHMVPKGTDVMAFVLHSHLNPQYFPDPYRFDPDRFLPENMKNLHPYCYAPFSAGPRGCPGKQYAYLVLKLIVPSIVREFKVYSDYCSLEQVIKHTDSEVIYVDKRRCPIRLVTRNPVQP